MSAPRDWLSMHLFLSDPVRTERYLRERLDPAIQRWRAQDALQGWFFIRYWEGGPHLRIRLCGHIAQDETQVRETLSQGIAEFLADAPPTREAYYAEHAFDGQAVAVDALPWYPEGTLARIDYQPETLRYGGEHAIEANERLFELSSRLALALCRATEGSPSARLSSAFALMAAAILACDEDLPGLGAYYQQYGSVWAQMIGREAAQTAVSPPSQEQLGMLLRLEQEAAAGWQGRSPHAVWALGVRELAGELRSLHRQGLLTMPYEGSATVGDEMCRNAVLGIVGSQIHMLNNRLGVPPAGEFLLARIVGGAANALRQQDAMA